MKKSVLKRKSLWVIAAVSLIIAPGVKVNAKWLAVHNDFNKYDTDGNPIRTRSGCLCKFGEKYYWYGCDQAMTNQTCYSSIDLLHWKNEGVMLTASRGTNRMDVVYNDSTKKYVMVMKWETPGSEWCNRGIAVSTGPTGPFTKLFDSLVYGVNTGDMSVFKDDDGKAYYLYELWDNGKTSQGFSLMTWDYIGLEKKMHQWPNSDREANMMMKNHGIYYYMTSKMMGIDPSETQYWTAPKIEGPWTTALVPIIAPGNTKRDSWSTQCDFVFPFKGTEDTVQMYCGDRWKILEPARGGDYVWLPITFTRRDSVVLNYYQDWEVDPDRGIWREIDSKRNLALNKTTTASSANGSNTANKATDPSTWQNYLNSKWESQASDPQWIMVDLGAEIKVNRVILKWDSAYAKSFKIQVSTDAAKWDDVYGTDKGRPRTVTDETFPTVTARYVRMYGTERGNTSRGYALFDFMILNDSGVTASSAFGLGGGNISGALLVCWKNRIKYSVASSNFVNLDVVDLHGKRVAVLSDDFKHAGIHEAVMPSNLGSGVYLIRLISGGRKSVTMQVRL